MPALPASFRPRQEIAPINAFDLGILAFVLIMGLMGLSVGFIKGGLWLMCWVGAIFATLYGYPYIEPMASAWLQDKNIITNKFLADVATGAGIFIVSLIFLFMISSLVSGWVRSSRLNALDRSLGFLAGLVAAVFIIATAYIPLSAAMQKPEDQPAWLREARLRPVVEWAAGVVQGLLPREIAAYLPEKAADRAPWTGGNDSVEAIATPRLPPQKVEPSAGYSAQERGDMERLIQSTGKQ